MTTSGLPFSSSKPMLRSGDSTVQSGGTSKASCRLGLTTVFQPGMTALTSVASPPARGLSAPPPEGSSVGLAEAGADEGAEGFLSSFALDSSPPSLSSLPRTSDTGDTAAATTAIAATIAMVVVRFLLCAAAAARRAGGRSAPLRPVGCGGPCGGPVIRLLPGWPG